MHSKSGLTRLRAKMVLDSGRGRAIAFSRRSRRRADSARGVIDLTPPYQSAVYRKNNV